jgi:predicted DCC family thiol-disulfide oxidoreductase YuxK
MKYQLPLILFDPECPLCLRFKQALEHLDKSLNFVSARDEEVYKVFVDLNQDECLEKVHMITAEGRILAGQQVLDQLLLTLPGVSKFSWLLENDQGRKVKDFFYQKVEELRELTRKREEGCDQCPRS